MYGENIKENSHYPRIIDEQAVSRIEKLLKHGEIYFGGEVNKNDRFISPTIID